MSRRDPTAQALPTTDEGLAKGFIFDRRTRARILSDGAERSWSMRLEMFGDEGEAAVVRRRSRGRLEVDFGRDHLFDTRRPRSPHADLQMTIAWVEGRLIEQQRRRLELERSGGARLVRTPNGQLTVRGVFEIFRDEAVPKLRRKRERDAADRALDIAEAIWNERLGQSALRVDQSWCDDFFHERVKVGVTFPEHIRRDHLDPCEVKTARNNWDFVVRAFKHAYQRRDGVRRLSENPMADIRAPEFETRIPEAFTYDRVITIISYAGTGKVWDEMMATLLTFAKTHGHREYALCALRTEDVMLTVPEVRQRLAMVANSQPSWWAEHWPHGAVAWLGTNEKGRSLGRDGYERICPLSEELREAYLRWLSLRKGFDLEGNPWVFPLPSDRTRHLTTGGASRRYGTIERRAERGEAEKEGRGEAYTAIPELYRSKLQGYRKFFANWTKAMGWSGVVESDFVGGWTLKHPLSTRRNHYEHLDPDLIGAAASHVPYWEVRPLVGAERLAEAERARARVLPFARPVHTLTHTSPNPLLRNA